MPDPDAGSTHRSLSPMATKVLLVAVAVGVVGFAVANESSHECPEGTTAVTSTSNDRLFGSTVDRECVTR